MIELKRRCRYAVPLAICLFSFTRTSIAADPVYKVVAHYSIETHGPITALVLDTKARTLYVADGSTVETINADSGAKVSTISVGAPVQGIALAQGIQRVFISTSKGAVRIVDTTSQKVVQTTRFPGKGPFTVAYDNATRHVFVADTSGKTITAIDGPTGKLISTVHISDEPGQMISNGYGHLFVAAQKQNVVHVVDTGLLKDLGAFPDRYGAGCGNLALDPIGRRLFVACDNGILNVIDTDIGFTFERLMIGSGNSQPLFTFSPQGKGGWKGAIFVASPDGTLTALRMNSYVSYSQGTKVHLPSGIRGIAFDSQTHRILIAAPTGNTKAPSSNAVEQWEILAVAE